MRQSIIKHLVLTMCLLNFVIASAYDFEVDGICYNITGETTVQVTFRYQEDTGLDYIGDIVIPSNVDYNGKNYTVTEIRKSTFYNCRQLTSVSIPNTVKSIGNQAFFCCTSLSNVNIPNGVTSIEKRTFFGCESLKRITIPNSVTSIDEWAFGDCIGLTRIAIPSSVTFISTYRPAFDQCSNVSAIIVESGNQVYDSRNSCNAIIETASNKIIRGCVNTIIPNSVTEIGNSAFNRCSNLSSIHIPNSVKSIGESAFASCEELVEINIPCSVTSIGNSAFWFCSSLTKMTIPNSVTSIGHSAFYCTNLKELIIPSSVTRIGKQSVGGCDSLTIIKVDNNNTKYDSRNNCNAIIETESNTLIAGCKNTIIPNTVTLIGDSAFYYIPSLTNITIPNSVTSIGNSSFVGCIGLKNITIPNSVITIGYNAFNSCKSMKSCVIGKSVTSIERYAFVYCDSLEIVTCLAMNPPQLGNNYVFGYENSSTLQVPNAALTIYRNSQGWKDFPRIEGITDHFEVDGIYYQWTSDNSVSVTYKDEEYNSYSGDIVIPQSLAFEGKTYQVTEIGENAFRFCDNLTSVSIPNSVTRIGDCAFQECSSLSYISIPNSVEVIGNHAFDYAGLTDVNLGNSIKTIGGNAFTGCQFSSLILPEGLLSIGENAFSECSLMKTITLPSTLVSIGELAFDMCSSLLSITIPKSVTNIGREAFEECQSLTSMKVQSVNEIYDSRNNCNAIIETATNTLIEGCQSTLIPNSVVVIGDYAFALCSELKSISIPSSVETIGSSAFMGCSSLKTIKIGENVNSVADHAFYDCDEITNVACFAPIPPSLFDLECFSYCVYDNAVLRVPKNYLEQYVFSEYWSEFLNIEGLTNGDVDGDGKINISDVTSLIDMLLRGMAYNPNADVDGDGQINISDVTTLIDMLLRGEY